MDSLKTRQRKEEKKTAMSYSDRSYVQLLIGAIPLCYINTVLELSVNKHKKIS